MKILMINPPIRTDEEVPHNFPTGLAIIAAVIRNLGHEVKVLDLNAIRKDEKWIKEFEFERFDVICIGSLVSTYKYVKELIKIIKEKTEKTKIIVGNSLAVVDKLLMKQGVDVVVHGEGEETITEVLNAFVNKKSLTKIKGISYNGKRHEDRPPMKDIDNVPYPAYDLFPMKVYLKAVIDDATKNPDMNMVVSRGCPYNCHYCYKNFGRVYRIRSVNNVLGEISLLKKKYGVRAIVFCDDNFGIKKDWLNEFCKKIKSYKMEWGCMTRVDSPILNEETLKLMKRSGCKSIGFGLESASTEILKNMNKGVNPTQMINAIKLVRKFGIRGDGSWMFGYPGETKESALKTINFCYENGLPLWWGYTTPYPETPLWEWAIKNKKIKNTEKDIEEYILKLNDVHDYRINLTNIPEEEFHKIWKHGINKVNKSFRVKKHRLIEYFKIYGIRGGIQKTFRYLIKLIKK